MKDVVPSVAFIYEFDVLILESYVQCGFLGGDAVQNSCQLIAISDTVGLKPLSPIKSGKFALLT